MIRILSFTAISLRNTEDNMATPCSVNAYGAEELCLSFSNQSQFVTSSCFRLCICSDFINSMYVPFFLNVFPLWPSETQGHKYTKVFWRRRALSEPLMTRILLV